MAEVDSKVVKAEPINKEHAEKRSKFFTVFTIPVLVGLITLCLSLMGYGRDLGYLGEFELTPQQLQRTPIDFLLRGVYGIFDLLDFDSKYLAALFSGDVALKVWWTTLPAVFAMSTLAIGCLYLGHRYLPRSREVAELHNPRRPWWGRRVASALKRDERRDARFRVFIYGSPFVFAAAIPLSLMLVAAIIWLGISVFLLPYILIPLKPATLGEQVARTEVILPNRCHPVGRPGDGAHCIRVVRNGCEIARGRYIEQSGNRVWLFHKKDRGTTSAPLDGNVTEDVGSEEVSVIEPSCSAPSAELGKSKTAEPPQRRGLPSHRVSRTETK